MLGLILIGFQKYRYVHDSVLNEVGPNFSFTQDKPIYMRYIFSLRMSGF